MPLTITEALAEVKTIAKRIEKKAEFIGNNLLRQQVVIDPHAKAGGSPKLITEERQGIRDLQSRAIAIRMAIMRANMTNLISVQGHARTIAEWLTWRKEWAPWTGNQLKSINNFINGKRNEFRQKGMTVRTLAQAEEPDATAIVVNLDESVLAKEIEAHELILGELDGRLSLANATIVLTEL